MLISTFATQRLPTSDQFAAWQSWYDPVFETIAPGAEEGGFDASNTNWTVGGLTISEVRSPPGAVARGKSLIRRDPVDHWVISLSSRTTSDVSVRGERIRVAAGIPFLVSLGEEIRINRMVSDDRIHLHLSRDAFADSAHLLDAAVGSSLDTAMGALLGEFLRLLRKNAQSFSRDDASHLKSAVQGMVEACLAPSAEGVQRAAKPIGFTLMERVRNAVTRHLRSPSLDADKLCREAATSRSQLYRLLEVEGGVARYIQRRRLSESFAVLCDTSNNFSIREIAEILCFADASGFSRAFRREFGMNPKEVRAASLHGFLPVAPASAYQRGAGAFRDCLRSV